MKKFFKSSYLLLLPRNEQCLNRYNSKGSKVLQSQVLQDILEHVVKKEGQKINYSFLDSVLFYLPGQNYPQKVQNEIQEEKEESVLEAEAPEAGETKENDDFIPTRYLPLEDHLLENFSYDGKTGNDNSYNSLSSLLSEEEEYEVTSPANDTYENLSTDEEAKENLAESKYDFIVSPVDVDYEEQQKLATWILFNPALFAFLESFYGLSRDVDYKSAA